MTADVGGVRSGALSWLLPVATALVILAVPVSGPIAFGIVMSGEDFPDTHSPYLYALVGLLFVAVASLIAAWIFAPRKVNRTRTSVATCLAAASLAAAGLIVATFSAEMLSVTLGF